jgi:predicted transposase/invertase (TIGR01784 family)
MADQISPRVDIAFKKIFGVEENKDLLIALINSIISAEDQIESVILLNPYNVKNFKNDKLSILGIKARSCAGTYFNIEIQISDEADYDKRALYYWAKLYSEQLAKGDDYSKLNKTIGIHILNFTSIPLAKKYHNIFDLKEKNSGFQYFKDIELHTIELNKFEANTNHDKKHNLSKTEELDNMLLSVKTALDMWIAFLTRHDLLDKSKLPKELDDANIQKALNVLDEMNFTPEEREAYEAHLKWLRVEASALKKMGAKSFAEGKAEGEKNKEVAVDKAKKSTALTIARKMIVKGNSVEEIMEMTELSREEIEAIQRKE